MRVRTAGILTFFLCLMLETGYYMEVNKFLYCDRTPQFSFYKGWTDRQANIKENIGCFPPTVLCILLSFFIVLNEFHKYLIVMPLLLMGLFLFLWNLEYCSVRWKENWEGSGMKSLEHIFCIFS